MAVNQSSQVFKGSVNNGVVNLNTNLYLTNVILIAKFDYESKEPHELDLKKNERLVLIDNSKNWWLVKKHDSDLTGYVPSNFVKKEKKSLLDKIIPRKLQTTTTTTTTTANQITTAKSIEEIKQLVKNGTYISKARVKHRYTATKSDELSLNTGIEVKVLEKFVDGWWKIAVSLENQELIGLYPSNYLQEELNTNINNNNNNNNNYSNMANTNSNNNLQINQDNPAKCESISSNEKEIEYVKVRYAHHAGPPNINCELNELNVSVNEILRIVEDESELIPDNEKPWLKVFNSRGLTGLIPYSCVEPCLTDNNFVFVRHPAKVGVYADQNWYFGNISRFDTILNFDKYAELGDFLVRDSDNGTFSISLKADGLNVKHFKIILKENKLTIGKKVFQTMEDLLQHYHKNPIFDQNGEKLYLVKPFDPPQ